jgi:oligoribonuclease
MNELIVVLDIETTGLSNRKDEILEVGILIANHNFEVIATKSVIIDPSGVEWDSIDSYVLNMHSTKHPQEGYPLSLIDELTKTKNNGTALTYGQAANRLIGFMDAHGVVEKEVYLAGSTISFDRGFLQSYMPELDNYFHYRSVDVSSLQAVIEMFYPEKALELKPEDRKIHRVIPDCEDSLRKYQWAVQTLMRGAFRNDKS